MIYYDSYIYCTSWLDHFIKILPITGKTLLSETISDLTGTASLMALYDANSITGIVDGDELTQWDDLSGNDNHLIKDTITGENSVTFKNEGIAGLPSVYFNGGLMETASASSTPSSRNVTMMWTRLNEVLCISMRSIRSAKKDSTEIVC